MEIISKDYLSLLDFDNLFKVFDKNSTYYNSITSSELRLVLEKYLDHPNLKFLLKKQVIDLKSLLSLMSKERGSESDLDFEKD